jgi:hypothetical protein
MFADAARFGRISQPPTAVLGSDHWRKLAKRHDGERGVVYLGIAVACSLR